VIGSQLLHSQRLYGREFAVYFDLGKLSYGEIEVTNLVGDEQHALDDGWQIEEAHRGIFVSGARYNADWYPIG